MRKTAIYLGVLLLYSSSCHSQELTLLTEDYKPFQYENEKGQVVGFGVELIKQIFKGTNIKIKDNMIHLFPWARAYKTALREKDTAVFMTVRNKKRERLFKWVGPLAPRKMWLYKLKKRKDIQLQSLKDAKRYHIGGYNKSADTNYMIELGFNVDIVPHQRLITNMLAKERLDLISSLELTMAARLKDIGLTYDIVEKAVLLDGRYDYYLAMHFQTSDVLVKELQLSLDKIKTNGTYERLRMNYLE